MFAAIYLAQNADRKTDAAIKQLEVSDLPEADVLVSIEYSTLNYKDALAITGKSPVVRKFPMVPGIDFAGVVEQSSSPLWKTGDKVVLNGFGVGEGHWGGLAGQARVRAEWLVRLPEGMNASSAMAIGTAGYTAMLCVMALERHDLKPENGPILVTGANGGVGSIAVALLAKLGYEVVAATGRPEEAERLRELGARQIVERSTLNGPGKPLQKEQWAGAIDSVGSHTLANVCAGLRYGGTVAACGLAQGMDLPSSVAPFILRGVTLAGVDSVNAPMDRRVQAWSRLAQLLSPDVLSSNTQTISLTDAITTAPRLLDGAVRGRVLVDVAR